MQIHTTVTQLSAKRLQSVTSSHNVNALGRTHVMRIDKLINREGVL